MDAAPGHKKGRLLHVQSRPFGSVEISSYRQSAGDRFQVAHHFGSHFFVVVTNLSGNTEQVD